MVVPKTTLGAEVSPPAAVVAVELEEISDIVDNYDSSSQAVVK